MAGLASAAATEPMPMRIEVEFDIYSGMPNPTWPMTEAEADGFVQRLAGLPPVAARHLSGHLGYRGFIVRMKAPAATRLVRIQNGTIEVVDGPAARYLADEGRQLERWFFEATKPHVSPELLRVAERDLR